MFRKLSLLNILLSAIVVISFSGCGGSGGGSSTPTATTVATISSQPAAVTDYETQTATFSVTASGSGTLSYQWKKNSTDISGATSSSFTTPASTLADSGASYSVAVTNSAGTVFSSGAVLTVQAAGPAITTAPTSQSVVVGATATFTVTATGLPTLTYQWLKGSVPITGATASSYSIVTVIGDNASSYSVTVTNGAGSLVTSTAATLTVQAASVTTLKISEVASCYYTNIDCWFEIYNPTSSAIDLSGYDIKSTAADVTTNALLTTTFVNLPSFSVPSGGYVIISGNVSNAAQRGLQMLRLRGGSVSPFWTASGFIELLSGGVTADFVRFGTSTQTPVTASEWTGASVAALPSSITNYGKSIVRSYPGITTTDTNTAGDWSSVNWSTPAGRNDVPVAAVDADVDGIPDSAEISGGTFSGLDLYAMGARVAQKDLFISINQMTSTDPGVIPRSESLQKVVDAFALRSIKVHFDAGTLFSSTFSVANFNLGQGNSVVPYEPCVTLDQTTCLLNVSSRRSIYDWKDEYMDLRRRQIFHYLLFGNSQLASGASGSSGLAELVGNDFIVTMGSSGWGFTTTVGAPLNKLINMQASTLMHELGHNLGLQHGGNEATNYKPNYWSVMNYMYQLNGLDANPAGITAYQRWRKEKGDATPTYCNLANSPCGISAQFHINYSDGSSSSLNEASLLEVSNIGRGGSSSAYADWDLGNSLTTTALLKDLNGDGAQNVLSDYNDWANLNLLFNRTYLGNSGVSKTLSTMPVMADPIVNDRQPVAEEVAPSQFFFDQLRHAQ